MFVSRPAVTQSLFKRCMIYIRAYPHGTKYVVKIASWHEVAHAHTTEYVGVLINVDAKTLCPTPLSAISLVHPIARFMSPHMPV